MIEPEVLVHLGGLIIRVSETSSLDIVHEPCIYVLIVVPLIECALIGIVLTPWTVLILF